MRTKLHAVSEAKLLSHQGTCPEWPKRPLSWHNRRSQPQTPQKARNSKPSRIEFQRRQQLPPRRKNATNTERKKKWQKTHPLTTENILAIVKSALPKTSDTERRTVGCHCSIIRMQYRHRWTGAQASRRWIGELEYC